MCGGSGWLVGEFICGGCGGGLSGWPGDGAEAAFSMLTLTHECLLLAIYTWGAVALLSQARGDRSCRHRRHHEDQLERPKLAKEHVAI